MPIRLAVFASGTGSLFRAMIVQGVPIELVLVDRKCRAYDIAAEGGFKHKLLPGPLHKPFNREEYTKEVLNLLREHHINLVAMAGFMTILSPLIFEPDAYRMKILNTHPSLLPAFKGHHAVKDALEFGVKVTGFTIHWATPELDAGPILYQGAVPVQPYDTVETLHERIKTEERVIYPRILRALVED